MMKSGFYRLVAVMTRHFGAGAFYMLVWPLTTAFFLLFPKRVAGGMRFYRTLLPRKSWRYHLWCTWCQYHNFARLFLDRMALEGNTPVQYTADGWQHFHEMVQKGAGAIVLMSHMGSWEVAAHLLSRDNERMRLMLYMGRKQQERIGRFIKDGLTQSGVQIVAVDADNASPLDILDGIQFLKQGGMVALPGDRPWSGRERTVQARFLNHEIQLLEAPHVLAMLSGAPIFVFFAFRLGKNRYHITVSEPFYVQAESRAKRPAAIQTSVQRYADQLERMARNYPRQWFNFGPFLGRPLD